MRTEPVSVFKALRAALCSAIICVAGFLYQPFNALQKQLRLPRTFIE